MPLLRALFRSQLMPDYLIGGHPRFDESFSVFVAFWRQLNVNCSARLCLSLRYKSFLSHRLDGPVHDSSVETQKRGDLILIERSAAPKCRQDEAASRGTLSLSFQPFPYREIGRGDMGQDGIFQDVFGNLFPGNDVHRMLTVAWRGLRHWGVST